MDGWYILSLSLSVFFLIIGAELVFYSPSRPPGKEDIITNKTRIEDLSKQKEYHYRKLYTYESTEAEGSWQRLAGVNPKNLDGRHKFGRTYEVTRYVNEVPNSSQLKEAWRLYNKTYFNIVEEGWANISKARRDGYKIPPREYENLHYPNFDYMRDNRINDPERPEMLLFRNISGDSKLVAAQFFSTSPSRPINPPGGPSIVPHFHVFDEMWCFGRGSIWKGPVFRKNKSCNESLFTTKSYSSTSMYHIWFVDEKKGGPFATSMDLSESGARWNSSLYRHNRSSFYERVKEISYRTLVKNETIT